MTDWPQWTAEITSTHVTGEDQLGLESAAQNYQQYLIPGVITSTNRARYYSFYAWVLYRFITLPGSSRLLKDFRGEFFRRHELALILGAYSHHIETGGATGVVGSGNSNNKVKDYWAESDPVSLDKNYFKNQLGGFGQYYRTTMQAMEIVAEQEHPQWVYRLTTRGEALALAYERAISNTAYFQELKDRPPFEFLSHQDAQEYGQDACICHEALKQGPDYPLLREAFFRFDEAGSHENSHVRRRLTLGVTLDIVYQGQGEITTNHIRPALYLGEYQPDHLYQPVEELEDWYFRWRMVMVRQLYTFSLDTLFAAFLLQLSESSNGLSFPEYMDWCAEQLSPEIAEMPLAEYMNQHCQQVGLSGNWEDCLEDFHLACNLSTGLDEFTLYEQSRKKSNDSPTLLRNGVGLLTRLILRNFPYYLEKDPIWLELAQQERQPLYLFIDQVNEQIADPSCRVIDFLKWLYREYILGQHEYIALEKLRYQDYDTFKFYFREGIFHWPFLTPDEYSLPIRLAALRLFNVITILEDLGLVLEDSDGKLSLSSDGLAYRESVIESVKNGG